MRALITGTFDPFTIGHKDIVDRALAMAESVVIGVGVNERKRTRQSAAERLETIARVYRDEPRVKAVAYSDLTVSLARREGCTHIVKGVRNVRDFEYERDQADINRSLTGIDTVLLPARPELSAVSSSVVRELEDFGVETGKWRATAL